MVPGLADHLAARVRRRPPRSSSMRAPTRTVNFPTAAPLLRAVDTGSPMLVNVVIGDAPRLRVPDAFRRQLLDLARQWYEGGVLEELRRRTGAAGPAVKHRIDDAYGDTVDEVSLGGLTVRDGHGAILTYLEWQFGVLPPLDEVMARALPRTEGGTATGSPPLTTRGSAGGRASGPSSPHCVSIPIPRTVASWRRFCGTGPSSRQPTAHRTSPRMSASWQPGHRTGTCSRPSWTSTTAGNIRARRPSASGTPTIRTRAYAARWRSV